MEHGGRVPIAVAVWQTMQRLMRAFDEQLAEHGGSRPVWHILLTLQASPHTTQRRLAAEVGIREATLTHHLRLMEERGLIARQRDPENRRVQQIEITPEGAALFKELRTVAMALDRKLRRTIGGAAEVSEFQHTLDRLAAAVDDGRPLPPLA